MPSNAGKQDQFQKLMSFLNRLQEAKISYRISERLYDAMHVNAESPSERWEVDFFLDGDVYVERLRSNGHHIAARNALEELFALNSDKEPVRQRPVNQNDAVARK
jgi:hypothetical protein